MDFPISGLRSMERIASSGLARTASMDLRAWFLKIFSRMSSHGFLPCSATRPSPLRSMAASSSSRGQHHLDAPTLLLGYFPSRRCFQPPDLALGAFDHLFPPNQMIRGNHTLRPEDKSLRCPLSEKHLHRYVAEFDIRYSNRVALGMNDMERAEKLARGIVGKRLTYRRSNEAGL